MASKRASPIDSVRHTRESLFVSTSLLQPFYKQGGRPSKDSRAQIR